MQNIKSILKITNMTYIKNFNNKIQLIILKINNTIFVFIERKFINILAKNNM